MADEKRTRPLSDRLLHSLDVTRSPGGVISFNEKALQEEKRHLEATAQLRNEARRRLEVTLAPDISPQEIADILNALNTLHVADSGKPLADPVIRVGRLEETPAPIRGAR